MQAFFQPDNKNLAVLLTIEHLLICSIQMHYIKKLIWISVANIFNQICHQFNQKKKNLIKVHDQNLDLKVLQEDKKASNL